MHDQLITRDDPAVIDHLVDHCCIVENRGFFMHYIPAFDAALLILIVLSRL